MYAIFENDEGVINITMFAPSVTNYEEELGYITSLENKHVFTDVVTTPPDNIPMTVWTVPDDFYDVDFVPKVIGYDEDAYNYFLRKNMPSITKRQFVLYLRQRGVWSEVDALIKSDPDVALEFEVSYKLERVDPTINSLTSHLGWTDEEVDVMWEEALKIN